MQQLNLENFDFNKSIVYYHGVINQQNNLNKIAGIYKQIIDKEGNAFYFDVIYTDTILGKEVIHGHWKKAGKFPIGTKYKDFEGEEFTVE